LPFGFHLFIGGAAVPNGLLQGDWGDVLNDVRTGASVATVAQALERLVVALTNPLNITQQIQVVSTGATGPVILLTVGTGTPPQAIGLQVGQGGPQVILGVGNTSFGLTANCLNNRDVCQTSNTDTVNRFTAAATKKAYSKTATGLNEKGIATGKPSSDVGTMTAGPGELMPNAQVSGLQKVWQGNFLVEGTLLGPLSAATHFLNGATTAQLQTAVKDPAGSGNLINGPIVTVTNRDSTLSAVAGSLCGAFWCNTEWRPFWISCAVVA
jgi:hypothetical protein